MLRVPSTSRSRRAQKKCWWTRVTTPVADSERVRRALVPEIQPAVCTMPVSFASNSLEPSW